ncbi:MAG: hypothetical protein A2527_04150 [Candidatus Lambdaproteobacteria bacterium RIFOXYD2_FULL_50_16]|uniref:D-2-hydroxyglutarate dehydrogenase n=1 Tax=Candidatus Lambdaproteobacteria bacterium RIFOXYD2_FULL_50_16 TaxID=1817772 RepID=A0A1F6GF92_9PROT|nr:MAG: hypothetical protein A2527_04150 [Candidatus Lambdaproteobacteria bacterium RIFOXYD2_FULL_50_16]
MIPRLGRRIPPTPQTVVFLKALETAGFKGEMETNWGERLVAGTDNSIYQLFPQAILYPTDYKDLKLVTKLLGDPRFFEISITAKGGGTGTNGQSLTAGITLDLGRHMTRILEINLTEGFVRVEPGLVLDQLNKALAPLGFFFAPTLSTSSRATLGGMISTDACGKGSRIYGKTSDHILELDCLLAGGGRFLTAIDNDEGWESKRLGDQGHLYKLIDQILARSHESITRLPQLDRFVSGYNLTKLHDCHENHKSLNYLIAGSEGTLVVVAEAKLKILPLVKNKGLLAICYNDFDQALADAEALVARGPAAIETIDGKILGLARLDEIIHKVGHMIGGPEVKGLNLVEFIGETKEQLEAQMAPLQALLEQRGSNYYRAQNTKEIADLWELRKKGVGLLGNASGKRRPIAFVEDTVVPPQHLAAYIKEFRALLESHGLEYGMFGHVDVGCLHVRPALDLRDPKDESLMLTITTQVADLVQKYGGVIWGEHGKGFRSELTEKYFGPQLYNELRRIKGAFDPRNQLNPGKIATAWGTDLELVKVDGPKRGHWDRQIAPNYQVEFEKVITCNGNGACYTPEPATIMCPSAKAWADRRHSPKGRAALMREWLRRLSLKKYDLNGPRPRISQPLWLLLNGLAKRLGVYDFSHEVAHSLAGCLACKACATACPIKVDIPQLKPRFLEAYHRRYPRPISDYLAANLEEVTAFQAQFPALSRQIGGSKWFKWLLLRQAGIVDPPKVSRHPVPLRVKWGALSVLNPQEPPSGLDPKRDVLLVQDSFTSFFEAQLVSTLARLFKDLGYQLWLLPFFPNGKALQVKGFLAQFKTQAQANHWVLNRAAGLGLPMIGLEPATTLTYRDEYPKILGLKETGYQVQLVQEFLVTSHVDWAARLPSLGKAPSQYRLLGHCTEKSLAPQAEAQWETLFSLFGLEIKALGVGCCGMSGMFGHERAHYDESRRVYELSWQAQLAAQRPENEVLLATGYSCRSQVRRFEGRQLAHPIEALAARLGNSCEE